MYKIIKMLVFKYQDQWVHLLIHPVHIVCHALEHKQQSDTHFHLSEELWHQIQTSVAWKKDLNSMNLSEYHTTQDKTTFKIGILHHFKHWY